MIKLFTKVIWVISSHPVGGALESTQQSRSSALSNLGMATKHAVYAAELAGIQLATEIALELNAQKELVGILTDS